MRLMALCKYIYLLTHVLMRFVTSADNQQLMARPLGMYLPKHTCTVHARFVANSKYKIEIQALFKDFQGPKLHFSSTKIIDKKPYPRRGHSKFRLQCDTEVYCTVLTNSIMIKASDNCQQMQNFKICKL